VRVTFDVCDARDARSTRCGGSRPTRRHPLHLQLRRPQTRRKGAIPPRNRHTERVRSVLGLNKSAPPPPSLHAVAQSAKAGQPVKCVNCIVSLTGRQSATQMITPHGRRGNDSRAPVSHANHRTRQSATQIIARASPPRKSSHAPVRHANHRTRQSATQIIARASRPRKSSQAGQSATQIIAAHGRPSK
jgi:hypothetical protein